MDGMCPYTNTIKRRSFFLQVSDVEPLPAADVIRRCIIVSLLRVVEEIVILGRIDIKRSLAFAVLENGLQPFTNCVCNAILAI